MREFWGKENNVRVVRSVNYDKNMNTKIQTAKDLNRDTHLETGYKSAECA